MLLILSRRPSLDQLVASPEARISFARASIRLASIMRPALGMAIEELERPAALERQEASRFGGGPGTTTEDDNKRGNKSRDIAAEAVASRSSCSTRIRAGRTIGAMKLLWALPAIAAALMLSGCASGGTSNGAPPAPDKYTQTWATSYAETTCDDWNTRMTGKQKFAAAADILTSARNKIDGGEGLPPDSLISQFQGGVTTACVVPSMTLTDVTYGLYTTEPMFHP